MATHSLDHQLVELESLRTRFGRGDAAQIIKLIKYLDSSSFSDATSLIRFHEALLFLRAFPHSATVLRTVERILNNFHIKVAALRQAGADFDEFDTFEFSGISGTEMEDTLSFDVARWLVRRMPGKVEIAWDNYDPGRELGTTGPRFMPLLEDDAYVEADTPWREWLEAASGKKGCDVAWLVERFENMTLSPTAKSELYESLRVPLRWKLENSLLTRTRNHRPVRRVFYQTEPLISRSQVSLADELSKPAPKLTKLSRRAGESIMDRIREVMLVRYRELYGTTLGDPASAVKTDVDRGVEIYLWNLPPARRLPLRAYVAGLTLKNGVPINYIEAIGLCEWMEVGFNTFYTFRGGEAGWIYAQVLRSLFALMGTTVVSVYPYQLGHDNEEAIASGAFWFYRKLGFTPGHSELEKLAKSEEKKIAVDPKYRTPARTLKQLATGHVFYALPGSNFRDWSRFSTRNIGLRVNRRMARDFDGDAQRMREKMTKSLEQTLGVKTAKWPELEWVTFENFALVLGDKMSNFRAWAKEERAGLVRIICAKAKPNEMLYLQLTQKLPKLRDLILKIGLV